MRVLVAAALLAALGTAPADAAGTVPTCTVLGLSPSFDRDGTAFCAGVVDEVAHVFRTKDRARSWHRVAAAGLGSRENVTQVVLSRERVAVQLARTGVYVSDDGGASFELAPGTTAPVFADDPPNVTVWDEEFVVAGPVPRRIGDPVPGTGAAPATVEALAFGAAPGRLLLARTTSHGLAHELDIRRTAHVYACGADLACDEPRRTFTNHVPRRIWTHGATTYLVLDVPENGTSGFALPRLFRSRDGGRTFTRLTSVDTIVDTIRKPATSCWEIKQPEIGVAFAPGRLYVRVSGWSEALGLFCGPARVPPAQPGDQLFESRDDGRTWQRVAWGLGPTQPGPKGTLPWKHRAGPLAMLGDVVAGGGRLFVVATSGSYTGPFCSRDGGRSWRKTC